MRLRRLRAAAQLLHRDSGLGPTGVVAHLLAVQAQDRRAARLALRARTTGLTAPDVERALGEERSLVIAWLARGTLHLVAREDYPWLLGLLAPARMTASDRRLGQEGVDPGRADRAVVLVERALLDAGPQTRAQLGAVLHAAGIATAGQALAHLLMRAALRGVAVIGPLTPGGEAAYAATRDWLGIAPPAPLAGAARDRALGELARRYLRAHAPASEVDLAAWSGLGLRDARAGLARAGAPAVDERAEPRPVAPRLLAAFDPYLLGYKDRRFAVPAQHARRVHPGGGVVRATATDDGLAVATWSLRRTASGVSTAIEPFADLPTATAAALAAERRDVARFAADEVSSARRSSSARPAGRGAAS